MRTTLAAAAVAVAIALGSATLVPAAADAAERGSISGRVYSDNGGAVHDEMVSVLRDGVVLRSTTSDHRGVYRLTGLPAGTFVLRYTSKKNRYLTEFSGDATTLAAASTITLANGEKRTRTSARLTPASTIVGRVLVNGVAADTRLGIVQATLVDASGRVVDSMYASPSFRFSSLTAGDYTIRLCSPDPVQTWLQCAYYSSTSLAADTSTVSLGTGSTATGLVARLTTTPGAVLPTRVTASVSPHRVARGKHMTVTAKVASYGDLSNTTVSVGHDGRVIETTAFRHDVATFRLSSTSWSRHVTRAHVKVVVNPSASTGRSVDYSAFHISHAR